MKFRVVGKPVGKQRPRHTRDGHTYTPLKTKVYEQAIADACHAHMLENKLKIIKSPCKVRICVMVDIPSSYTKKRHTECLSGRERPGKKPDIDNIAKSIMDGLNGVAYIDDKQVVGLEVEKHYWEYDAVYIEVNEV